MSAAEQLPVTREEDEAFEILTRQYEEALEANRLLAEENERLRKGDAA